MDEKLLAGTKGVIYCRRSTGTKAQKETSLIEQKRICTKVAEELGIQLPYQVFAEECNSSSTPHEFNLLKHKVVSGEIEVDFILIEKGDRFKREYVDSRKQNLQPLHDNNVQLIFAIGSGSRIPQLLIAPETDASAKILEVVEVSKNADYVADLAERLSHRMYEKASKGTIVSKKAFGWKTIRTFDDSGVCVNRVTVPDEDQAHLVVEMFDKFRKTKVLTDCIPILEKHKSYPKKRCIACKVRLKTSRGLSVSAETEACDKEIEDVENETVSKCGSSDFETVQIMTPTIRSILRNAFHAGRYTYFKQQSGKWRTRKNGKVVDVKQMQSLNRTIDRPQNINPKDAEVCIEEHHQGIVDVVVFDDVQKMLDVNKTDNSCKGPKAKGVYTGRVICECCKSSMTYGATQGRPRYTCDNSKRSNTKKVCPGGTKSIRADDLEQIVLDGVFDVVEKPEFWQEKIQELDQLVRQREEIRVRRGDNQEVDKLRADISTLAGQIENTDYRDQIQVIQERKILIQKLELEKTLEKILDEENKYLGNPVLQILDHLKDGRKYQALVAEFEQHQKFFLMGVSRTNASDMQEVDVDSDMSQFGCFYLVSDAGNSVVFELEKLDLFSELMVGDYWGLVCAGYLLKMTGLDDFQLSVLLAQSFRRWEPDSSVWFWCEILDQVILHFVDVEQSDQFPLAQKLVLKNQKQVVCGADVIIGDRLWRNDTCGGTSSRCGRKPREFL